MTIGNIATVITAHKGPEALPLGSLASASSSILMVVAGSACWSGKGLIWGSAALALMVFDFVVYGQELTSVHAITSVCGGGSEGSPLSC